jgi:DNA-directed RNA polymerase subunit RPC12/RpoP
MFIQYKKVHNTVPICPSCGSHILVGEKIELCKGRLRKYFCKTCSKKDVLVYQYPTARKRFKGNHRNNVKSNYKNPDSWVHEIQSTTSM